MTDRLMIIAEECGVDPDTLSEWVEERLIILSDDQPDEEILERACQIRRLLPLGVNLAGVEMILHMRGQILDHQTRIRQLEDDLRQLQRQHETEIARLLREFTA